MGIKSQAQRKVMQVYQRYLDIHEAEVVNRAVENEDFLICDNLINGKVRKVAFVFGSLALHSGGHTSVLRLGSGLCRQGYDITFVSFTDQSADEMAKIAKSNYEDVDGKFESLSNVSGSDFDVVVATSWQSVYYVRRLDAYKMYFVQDYEPFFFKLNERYLLAKKTYELGLHIVSLGSWNIDQIKRNCTLPEGSRLDSIDFPYEPKEYKMVKKRTYEEYGKKTKYTLAVYSKEDGKRIPNLLQIILKKASDELRTRGINLDIRFFGFDKNTKVQVGVNLGKLNKSQMADLYNEADFGMVASMTNISLVPYEMIATGLPVIEFMEGSFPYFFGKNAALLIDFNYMTLVNAILDIRENSEQLKSIMKNATDYMNQLTWEKSCQQFCKILSKLIGNC